MKMLVSFFASFVLSAAAHAAPAAATAHAGAAARPDLASFHEAHAAFAAGRAPTATELQNALWMATSVASRVDFSGSFPTGRIPQGDGTFYRQIARFTVAKDSEGLVSVDADIQTTEADTGIDLGSVKHTGSLMKHEMVLEAPGDASSCATRSECRLISADTLVCAQSSDDSRAQCTRSYKRGVVSSYLGYRAVHP